MNLSNCNVNRIVAIGISIVCGSLAAADNLDAESTGPELFIGWKQNYLSIYGEHLPGKSIEIHYLEAYCRADSTAADWTGHTVVPHHTELVEATVDRKKIRLRCRVSDGVVVDHRITAGKDEVDFQLVAQNPTEKRSEVHWAQPCIRIGKFSGTGPDDTDDKYAYVQRSFLFVDGKWAMMPTPVWATEARYTPGQVWCPKQVPRTDVNPRPLNPQVPSNGLIGCYSADRKMVFGVAFEPYQELFQGVIRCLHSDFRLGGLKPGETRKIRGKIYLVATDVPRLLKRYEADFPEHVE